MVKIRLRPVGAKKKPAYRVVVTSSTSPRNGKFLEILGHYNPRTEINNLVINEERALYWLRLGAQPTRTTARLLTKLSILQKIEKGSQKKSEEETPQANQS
ncbi:MAG: 30S ribosomal protein S16 [Dehalococcoidia bacterium]|nr:ribosomal protein [Dehalococcoidia bacterium]MDO8635023.1 30S ribosomal protein S16 [Dehalococcoidia bacterium]